MIGLIVAQICKSLTKPSLIARANVDGNLITVLAHVSRYLDALKINLILISRPLAAGTKPMRFPKGRSKALPFGRLRSTYPADDIKLIPL